MGTWSRAQPSKTYFFAVLLGASLLACSPEARKARHLERADKYFDAEQYREAILEYRNVLQIEDENAHANLRLGLAYFETGFWARAHESLQKAKKFYPDELDVRIKLATIYLIAKELDKARSETWQVLEMDPTNLDALVLESDMTESLEDIEVSLQKLHEVQELYDDSAKLHLALGNLYLKKKDLETAGAGVQSCHREGARFGHSAQRAGQYFPPSPGLGQCRARVEKGGRARTGSFAGSDPTGGVLHPAKKARGSQTGA